MMPLRILKQKIKRHLSERYKKLLQKITEIKDEWFYKHRDSLGLAKQSNKD